MNKIESIKISEDAYFDIEGERIFFRVFAFFVRLNTPNRNNEVVLIQRQKFVIHADNAAAT